ncbi:hypothetical protein J0H58_12365 [bacterium]|nr:hypothetical protein [bacterium]
MLIQTESKAQGWRAIAVFEDGSEGIVFIGRSSTHVRQEYVEAYLGAVKDEEWDEATTIRMEQWSGAPDAGRWVHKSNLKVPSPVVAKVRLAA